jgi:hypothetical protein
MDIKILEKLVIDYVDDRPNGYLEEVKDQHLQYLTAEHQKRKSELEQFRQKDFDLFMDALQLRIIELSRFANFPGSHWRNTEMAHAAVIREYLQRITFLSDIEAYYRKESIELFQHAERKAKRQLEEWKAQDHLLLKGADKEELRELKKEAIKSNQNWGNSKGSLHFNGANKEQVINRLSFRLFGIDTGQDRNRRGIYVTKLGIVISEVLKVEYLNGLIDGSEAKTETGPKNPKRGTPDNPTQWQLAAYYRYLRETDYSTPFDSYKTQKPAFEEIAKQHSKYWDRSPGAFKQQWNLSNEAQRPHAGNLPDLRVVLEMLKNYPRAAKKCKGEIEKVENEKR